MFNISNNSFRKILSQALIVLTAIASYYMPWRTLEWALNIETPIALVINASASPGVYPGTILFQYSSTSPIKVGEIVVFKLPHNPVLIAHRVIQIHANSTTGEELILTKGDCNPMDDRTIYRGDLWLEKKYITSRIKGHLPYIGKILLPLQRRGLKMPIPIISA